MSAPFEWTEVSREFLITCDADGAITWADDRARHRLRLEVGSQLADAVVPGTEAKTRALLQQAVAGVVRDCEVPLVVDGVPTTVAFAGRPSAVPGPRGDQHSTRIELHGVMLAAGYSGTIREIEATMADVVSLNREIARQKKELTARHDELTVAYQELDESSRAVLSLHAEIADKADSLRRTSEVKSRVVANLSHELRTPLNAITGLAGILLSEIDGPLGDEQRKQVTFIRSSADQLTQLVNDLLELARTEGGKLQIRPEPFAVEEFFSAFRGTIRPLLPADSAVELIVEAPATAITMHTDQGKIAQILRNLVTNALKFTEHGQVGVSASHDETSGLVTFAVADTGIGIAAADFERIFEEFGQVDNEIQKRVRGTGLGLPLSRKLSEVLGGTLTVESEVGSGSTFRLVVPATHLEVSEIQRLESRPLDPAKAPVLVVEDDRKTIFVYEKYLAMAGFQVVPARTIADARRLVREVQPSAVVLDIMLENESSWTFLSELKTDPATSNIPVLVVTVTSGAQKARALGADEFWLKPVDRERLIRKLKSVTTHDQPARLLLIDDEERSRYVIRKLLDGTQFEVREAATGAAGLEAARQARPDVILLDFLLEETTAFDVLDELKADPRTRSIPVVIVTSHLLDADERRRLSAESEAIISKNTLTRELAINRIRDALRKSAIEVPKLS